MKVIAEKNLPKKKKRNHGNKKLYQFQPNQKKNTTNAYMCKP
jgi:hypothetical protein